MGGKRRTMQLKASTAYWETLVDKWEASAAQSIQRAFADGKQLGAKLETAGKSGISRICKTRGRQVWSHAAQRPRASTRHLESASQAAKIIQHTWKPWGTSGSVSHADQGAPTLYLATVKDKQETSAYRSKSGTPIIRWIMLTLNTNIIYIYMYINSAL